MVETKRRWGKAGLTGTILLVWGIIAVWPVSAFSSQSPPDAGLVGNAACLDCHDAVGESYGETIHGILSGGSAEGSVNCESCHGPGSAHIEAGDAALIGNPAKSGRAEANLCLSCHNTGQFSNWEFAHHNVADMNCAGCHTIHGPETKWSKMKIQELCYSCHGSVRSQMHLPSHHPVNEGLVNCLDCHAIHGGTPDMALDNTGRELCLSCHPEKEGPFVFEHAPVNENCTVCHSAHGSVADNLLVQNEPTLCLNCHPMHFHATIVGVDGAFATPQAPERAGISTPDGWKEAMLTKCTQCHSEIHGSDLPSQAISSQGQGLTR